MVFLEINFSENRVLEIIKREELKNRLVQMNFSERGQGLLKWGLYGIIILSLIMVILSVSSGFLMDYYWFSSVGYSQVFIINIKYQLALLFVGWATATLCLFMAFRRVNGALGGQIPNIGNNLLKFVSVLVGFGVGWWFRGKYLIFLKYVNQVPWGTTDPIFGHDISFYVFTLPFIETAITFVMTISVLVLFFSGLIYGIVLLLANSGEMDISMESGVWEPSRYMKSWPVWGPIIALTAAGALSIWLGRFSYLWSFEPGASVPTGASYMATHYNIPYTWVESLGVILLGSLIIHFLMNYDEIRKKLEFSNFGGLKKEIGLLVVVVAIFAVVPGLVFGAINSFSVTPNEPGIQRPYIERTINFTNKAYDLEDITEVTYSVSSDNLSVEEALSSPTVKNARIVDYRPIKTTYEQKQRLRTYYEFYDVDVDRYHTEEGKQLAVISGREMSKKGGGWQNQHLFYTHGFGTVTSPASKKEADGSPIMVVKDIPPVSEWENTRIHEPRIYYGEMTDSYVISEANGLKEFDYPKGENNVQYIFENAKGINIGSPWKKLLAWFYTGDYKTIVSNYVGSESRLLIHRNVHDRVEKIAPFLDFDSNAQLFIGEDGGMNYLLNGITHASRYPYSYSDISTPGYLSDSVKAFVKSNTGKVQFYSVDESDPVAETYSRIYPDLFKDGESMPSGYRRHLVYPPDLFNTQMKIFRRYHMKDYQSFYQQEDLWSPAEEKYHGLSKRVEPYNILLNASQEWGFENKNEEFTLIKPFTPEGKKNMRAWVGVAQDPGNYGKMVAIRFPKGEFVRGPEQVEGIIDQDEEISRQFSLWSGKGSGVLRGNLLVLPVKNNVLYIEPIYLSAEGVSIPQLKQIVAVYRDEAAMEENLESAVRTVLGERPEEKPPENILGDNLAPAGLVNLVREYLDLSEQYRQLVNQGQYAKAGEVRENMLGLQEDMKKYFD